MLVFVPNTKLSARYKSLAIAYALWVFPAFDVDFAFIFV
jgi:hypothetical protein